MFGEGKQRATAWEVKRTFTEIRKRKTPKYFDELSSNERLLDAEQYFKTQIYFCTLHRIIEQSKHSFNGVYQILKL